MSETRTQLLTRKRDLFAALRLLERDHDDGGVDDSDYAQLRARYESEAATILQRLDAIPNERPVPPGPKESVRGGSRWLIGVSGTVVVIAIALFLVVAVRNRTPSTTSGATATPAGVAQIPARLAAALSAARAHPRSANAQVELGNQWFQLGRLAQADASYRRAEQLAPTRPEPKALHAWMIGLSGKPAQALTALAGVERVYPRYARAWLIQGLVLAQRAPGLPRAVIAWRHFLQIEPHSAVAAEVRVLIGNALVAERKSG